MKKYLFLFLCFFCSFCGELQHPGQCTFMHEAIASTPTSTIDPTKPATNAGLTSAMFRSQFAAAYNDINTLYNILGTVTGTISVPGSTGDVLFNSGGTFGAQSLTTLKANLNLNNVQNTALSTWAGSTNITTLGTVVTGTVPLANTSGTWTVARGGTGLTAVPGSSGSVVFNSGGTYSAETLSTLKTNLSLNNVENTTLSTWAGSTNITTLGTIATGTVPLSHTSGTWTVARGGTGLTAVPGSTGDVIFNSGGTFGARSPVTCQPYYLTTPAGDVTTGTPTTYFVNRRAATLTAVFAHVSAAATGSAVTVDVKNTGVSVLGDLIHIDANTQDSAVSSTPATILSPSLAANAVITFTVVADSGNTAAGLTVDICEYNP